MLVYPNQIQLLMRKKISQQFQLKSIPKNRRQWFSIHFVNYLNMVVVKMVSPNALVTLRIVLNLHFNFHFLGPNSEGCIDEDMSVTIANNTAKVTNENRLY